MIMARVGASNPIWISENALGDGIGVAIPKLSAPGLGAFGGR